MGNILAFWSLSSEQVMVPNRPITMSGIHTSFREKEEKKNPKHHLLLQIWWQNKQHGEKTPTCTLSVSTADWGLTECISTASMRHQFFCLPFHGVFAPLSCIPVLSTCGQMWCISTTSSILHSHLTRAGVFPRASLDRLHDERTLESFCPLEPQACSLYL